MLSTMLLWMGLAQAATFDGAPMDVDALSDQAAQVVVGEVRATRAVAGGPGIETVAEIRVTETLLGAPSPVVTVRIPGGELDGVVLTVPGAPRLTVGEQVVLFMDDNDQIVGFNQGAFHTQGGMVWSMNPEIGLVLPMDELRSTLR